MAWRVVAHAIMNRVGVRDWDKYGTAYKIVTETGFDAFKYPNAPYLEILEYLKNRDYANERIERFLEVVLPIIMEEEADITNNVAYFYSPETQKAAHKRDPKKYREVPRMAEDERLEEAKFEGTENDDFRFFRFKD